MGFIQITSEVSQRTQNALWLSDPKGQGRMTNAFRVGSEGKPHELDTAFSMPMRCPLCACACVCVCARSRSRACVRIRVRVRVRVRARVRLRVRVPARLHVHQPSG